MNEVRVGPRHAASPLRLLRFTHLSVALEKRASLLLVLHTPLVVAVGNALQFLKVRINRDVVHVQGVCGRCRFQVAEYAPNRGVVCVPVVVFQGLLSVSQLPKAAGRKESKRKERKKLPVVRDIFLCWTWCKWGGVADEDGDNG